MKKNNDISKEKEYEKFCITKHGINQSMLSKYEQVSIDQIKSTLMTQENPSNLIEEILLERIAIHTVKLARIQKAEAEFIRSVLDPKIIENSFDMDIGTTVIKEGYKPQIDYDAIEKLLNIYSRYETAEENKLFRAINLLRAIHTIVIYEN